MNRHCYTISKNLELLYTVVYEVSKIKIFEVSSYSASTELAKKTIEVQTALLQSEGCHGVT